MKGKTSRQIRIFNLFLNAIKHKKGWVDVKTLIILVLLKISIENMKIRLKKTDEQHSILTIIISTYNVWHYSCSPRNKQQLNNLGFY